MMMAAKNGQRNNGYWSIRMAALENDRYQSSAAYYKDVQEQFRRASNSMQMDIERCYVRLAENNDISYAAAKRLLKKGELEEFKWDVQQYIKAGEENAIDRRWMKELENASARHHLSYLEAMKLQTRQHAELLSTEFEGGMTDFLHKSYSESYYHTAYEMAKGTGVGTNLARLDSKRIDAVIQKPWAQDGANFSDRIWSNKQKLIQNLHTELSQNIIRGESPQKAIDSLAKTMNVSRAQAGRLIMTESAAIASAAQKDSLKELGVEQYEILATLDSKTSEICQSLDGQVFDMKDYEVGVTAPPFHPNCRSTTVPHFDDEFTDGEERAARDEVTGKTYYVPAGMKYGEWKRVFTERPEKEEKIRTSDLEWNLKGLEGLKPVTSNIMWSKQIGDCDEEMLNEAHTKLNRTMIEEHVEMLSVIEKGEKGIYYQKGEDIDAVTLSKETINKLKKAPDNSIIFSHVHPGKTTFSHDDLKKMVDFSSISDMTLECADGTKYIMSRGTYKSSFVGKIRFDSTYNAVYNEVAEKYPQLNDSEKIYDVWDDFMFDVNDAVAKKLGFVFKEIK